MGEANRQRELRWWALPLRLAFASGVANIGLPRAVWGHHPGAAGEGPWAWVGSLVVIGVFVAIWSVQWYSQKRSARTKPPKRTKE